MPYNCCSGNFTSRSRGSYLCYPGSSCGSSYPSNLVYSTNLGSPSTCQLDSSLYSGCQETCCEPTSCQRPCMVSGPCQTSCYRPRTSMICSPCQTTCARSPGFGSRSCSSLGCGSRSSCSLGCGSRSGYSSRCGSSGFRSLNYGVCGFPSLGYRSSFCNLISFPSRSCQSSCYRPTCGSGFYGFPC